MDPFIYSDQDDLQYLWNLSVDPAADLLGAVTQHLSPPRSAEARQSAFSKYMGPIAAAAAGSGGGSGGGIHRRIIELLRRIRRGKEESRGGGGVGESRVFRHMMRERQRRERLSQSYADLYSMLSPRTKADKNSIVQSAAALVRELKGVKEELQQRNEELMKMASPPVKITEGTSARIEQKMEMGGDGNLTVRTENSTSAIDSVIEALRCLEQKNVKARAIRAEFAGATAGSAGGGGGGGVMKIETI